MNALGWLRWLTLLLSIVALLTLLFDYRAHKHLGLCPKEKFSYLAFALAAFSLGYTAGENIYLMTAPHPRIITQFIGVVAIIVWNFLEFERFVLPDEDSKDTPPV